MKHYIFLSYITGSGGMQCYVAAKAKYLEEQGWHVVIISGNNPDSGDKCPITYLDKFLPNGTPLMGFHPCDIPKYLVKRTLRRMIECVGNVRDDDEVIVESWNSPTALWGELLAAKLHGRHIFMTGGETFRKKEGAEVDVQLYEEKIDFYMFKMDRGEIFTATHPANRLFEGYRTYKEGDFIESVITEAPVQDIESPKVNAIKKYDWTVCYLGRSNKPYVPNIFDGVGEFARNHTDKKIQFVLVGDVNANRDRLEKLEQISNLNVMELGDTYPIPRKLYSKIDVMIAGSGSARHSADEGALVIIADTEMRNSHGLLGYDTNESIYRDENALDLTFAEALERALVQQTWREQENKWIKYPGIEECTKVQFDIIAHANPKLEYYDEKKILSGKKTYIRLLRSIRANIMINMQSKNNKTK